MDRGAIAPQPAADVARALMADSVCLAVLGPRTLPYRSTASVIREFEGGHTLSTTHSQIDMNNKENKTNDISICSDLNSALIYVQKIIYPRVDIQ